MPDRYFFVKDHEGHFLYVNRALLDRLHLSDLSEIQGTTDYDRYPVEIADELAASDRAIMESREGVVGKVEALLNEQGILDWYVTSKFPLLDGNGGVIGVVGMVRKYELTRMIGASEPELDAVVSYIRQHPQFPHRVAELAKRAHLSTRQLHRKFSSCFGMNVQEFINRSRVQASSADLLDTRDGISEIAARYGFCNHSAYTRMFHRLTGMTPLQFRRKYSKD
jgi:AraC-like DNA-binding protein